MCRSGNTCTFNVNKCSISCSSIPLTWIRCCLNPISLYVLLRLGLAPYDLGMHWQACHILYRHSVSLPILLSHSPAHSLHVPGMHRRRRHFCFAREQDCLSVHVLGFLRVLCGFVHTVLSLFLCLRHLGV